MTNSVNSEVAFKLAKKYRSDNVRVRPMVNAYLDETEFAAFETLSGRTVRKRRFVVDGFSLDVFEGLLAGLVLTEQEAPDTLALDGIRMPDWAIREVTDDRRFEGGRLANMSEDEIGVLLEELNR